MRMSEDLKAAIEREASLRGHSRSQAAETLLRHALTHPKQEAKHWNGEHLHALGQLIAKAAYWVEISTGVRTPLRPVDKTWRDNPGAAAALRVAVDLLLQGLSPDSSKSSEAVAAPEQLDQGFAGLLAPEQRRFYSSPEGVGSMVGLSLLDQLYEADEEPPPPSKGIIYADVYFEFPRLAKHLRPSRDSGGAKER
jgi:hypothetical protein